MILGDSAAVTAWLSLMPPAADHLLTWAAAFLTSGGIVQAWRWWRRVKSGTARTAADREDAVAVLAPTAEMLAMWRAELKATQDLAVEQRAEIARLRAVNRELRRGPEGCPLRDDCEHTDPTQ